MKRLRPLVASLVACAVALVGACAKKDPVEAALSGIEAGAEKRDAAAVLEWVAPDFEGGGWSRAEAEQNLRRWLLAYQGLDVTIRDLKVERGGGVAFASFRADLSGTPRAIGGLADLLPRSSSWRFEVRLAPGDGGRWRIYRATWQAAD